MAKIFAVLLLLSTLLVVAGSGVIWWRLELYLDTPIDSEQPLDIVVEPGTSLTAMVYRLAQQDLLRYPRLLIYYLRVTGQISLAAGEYRVDGDVTPRQLLYKLGTGEQRPYSVTLLEGWTFRQALAQLQAQEPLQKLLDASDVDSQMQALGVDAQYSSPEGLFFPDTYSYVRGMSDRELLQTAYRKMQAVITQQWPERADDLPVSTPYQALILASIVEKETAVDSERELIAGVFVGRLRKGMRLQTDPTVIYAMGEAYQGNIRRKDLQIDSPYNTYRVSGLPPTPIALPSLRSIEAALHPEATDKVYFVARGDGSHYFSATLEEHNRAVQEYQIRRRAKNYRSVPAPPAN